MPDGRDSELDDVTLARKVETEIFRAADAPKGAVSVNAEHGVITLRGEVKRPEQVTGIGEAAAHVDGVRAVENLLHTPGVPPPHAPPDPGDVKERARTARPT